MNYLNLISFLVLKNKNIKKLDKMQNLQIIKQATGYRLQATDVRSNNKFIAVLKYLKYSLLPLAG